MAKQTTPPTNPLGELVHRAEDDVRQEETPTRLTSQTVPFPRLHIEPGHNPRAEFPEEGLRDLAQTIEAGGLYQPLMVRADPDRRGHYIVIAGERRYRALQILIDEGRADSDYAVPIYVRGDIEGRTERLLAALVENLQSEGLSPLEEAEAFAELRDDIGLSTEEIADRVGKSKRTVQERLSLLALSDEVRAALREGEIPLTISRVLTTAPPGLQAQALERFRHADPPHRTDAAMRRFLRSQAIPFKAAVFDPERYVEEGGEVYTSSQTVDREAGAHNSYFADRATFLRLQREALDEQHQLLSEQYDWIEDIEAPRLPPEFTVTGSGPGAVILRRQGLFDVEVYTGVEHRPVRWATVEPTAPSPAAPSPPPAPEEFLEPPNKARLAEAARSRNRTLQEALAADPDAALRAALAAILTSGPSVGLRLEPPPREQVPERPPRIERVLRALGETLDVNSEELLTSTSGLDEATVYRKLRVVPSGTVQAGLAALVASTSGVWFGGSADPHPYTPPLLAELAHDLGVTVAEWTPSAEYLEHYTAKELRALAERFAVDVPRSARKADVIRELLASERFVSEYRPPELAIRGQEEDESS